jgi:hypothetical protein
MRPLLLPAALSALALSSCFSPGNGQAPPLDRFYFPTGVALDTVTLNDPKNDSDAAIRSGKPQPKYLYVASSDFDLQYRSSSLASFDLDKISGVVPRSCAFDSDCDSTGGETCDATANPATNGGVPSFFCVSSGNKQPCGKFGEHTSSEKLLYPGRCNFIDPIAEKLLVNSVGIGAFATDVIIQANPTAGSSPARLFLPVRGDATLHWIDLDADGTFQCGQSNTGDDSCDSTHRAGNQANLNPNAIIQPSEPFAIAGTSNRPCPDGITVPGSSAMPASPGSPAPAPPMCSYVAVTNQTTGSVSLFVNNWSSTNGPALDSIATGLPSAPVGIAAIPDTLPASTNPPPGFLVAYRNAPQIDLLRLRVDPPVLGPSGNALSGPRFVLTPAASAPINANSLGFDSRGIVIDDAQRQIDYQACTALCAGLADEQLTACQATPAFVSCAQLAHQPDVYVANRAPSSLLVGRMTPDFSYAAGSSELPSFIDSIALTSGPSRVVLGSVKVPKAIPVVGMAKNLDYDLEPRVFVVCFDSRRIFGYDPKRRVIEAIITTGRGPFALAIDEDRGLGYIAHFTDSYLGVISLDQRFPQTYASVVASIGPPSPPRASK